MSSYKELDAFETNEFQQNDLILDYSNGGNRIFKVINVFDVFVEYRDYTDTLNDNKITHFKCARKLEKQPPREFYIHPDCSSLHKQFDCETNDRPMGYIKVREVTDE